MLIFVVNEIIYSMNNLDRVLQDFFSDDTYTKQNIIISIRNNTPINKSQSDTFYVNVIIQHPVFLDFFARKVIDVFNNFLTSDDFQNEIQEFKNNFLSKFVLPMKKLCDKTLKQEIILSPMISKIIKNYISHSFSANQIKFDVQETDIELLFESVSKTIINNNSENLGYKQIIQSEIQKYLKNTVTQKDFNDDSSHSNDSTVSSSNAIFVDKFFAKHNRKPNLFEETEFSSFLTNIDKLAEIYLNSFEIDFSINFDDIILSFSSIFEREITIHEYQRYYKKCLHIEPKIVFEEYKDVYTSKFNICENIYKQYTQEHLHFQIFTNTFLQYIDLDENTFMDKTICIIINDKLYETKMKSLIEKQYIQLFSTHIEQFNLSYYYTIIHTKKYHLEDDRIIKTISELNDETKTHISIINEIFEKILLRTSDVYENEKYLMYFRDVKRVTPTNDIEDELYLSLEYQDVIKDWIHDNVKIKNRSVVFKILEYIQQYIDNKDIRNLDTLLKKLKQVFKEYF